MIEEKNENFRLDKSEKNLKRIKGLIEEAHEYFKNNIDRYKESIKFTFDTSLSNRDRSILEQLKKPIIEFNIIEAQISRLLGEFAKHQPAVSVRIEDGVPQNEIDENLESMPEFIENFLRYYFLDVSKEPQNQNLMKSVLGGGYGVYKVYTDYINELSMEQVPIAKPVVDPTLCGFDPLAKEEHKGDGRFCFEFYFISEDEFKEEYGTQLFEKIKATGKKSDGFGWTVEENGKKTIRMCDFYEKVNKKKTLVRLTDGKIIFKDDYEKYVENWINKNNDPIEQPPQFTDDKRKTYIQEIIRFRLCGAEILKAERTNYSKLPFVFVDGNSVYIYDTGRRVQMTRSYTRNAEGIQRLKNFAGQTLANELENLSQTKISVSLEALPKDVEYLEAYKDPQKFPTIIHHAFVDGDHTKPPLAPPQPFPRIPIPQEIMATFSNCDQYLQYILGSHDSSLGNNRQEVSGTALALSTMQSNLASIPYIMGYINALNRVAQIIVDLIPKYYKTPRSVPILLPNGKREYYMVNSKQPVQQYDGRTSMLSMNYSPHSLNVKVEVSGSFSMQKELTLKTLITMMQASPVFEQFINEKGIGILLDNLEIRGIDLLKAKVEEFEQEQDKKQAMQQQTQMQMAMKQEQRQDALANQAIKAATIKNMQALKQLNSPTKEEIEMNKISMDSNFKAVEADQNQQKLDMEYLKLMKALQEGDVETIVKIAQVSAEQARTAANQFHTLVQATVHGLKAAHEISYNNSGD